MRTFELTVTARLNVEAENKDDAMACWEAFVNCAARGDEWPIVFDDNTTLMFVEDRVEVEELPS